MTGFNDIRFSNVFARVHAAANPGLRAYQWESGGVSWQRNRHGHHGPHYFYQCETFILSCAAKKNPWVFLYVVDTWWGMDGKTVLRNNNWGKLMQGRRPDVVAWFKAQTDKLEGRA